MTVASYAVAWRVLWADFRGHHVKPPTRHMRAFLTRHLAENFVAELRRQIPADELAVQIVDARKPIQSKPIEQLLPGDWPLQRRDRGAF